ncbi:HD domain-containing protein [Saccharothrix stipae]
MNINAWSVAENCLAQELPKRWAHVRGVRGRANLVTGLLSSADDRQLLLDAATLHDIGYSSSLVRTAFHALDGAYYLEEIGAPRRLCALVAHHSCARLEAELRGLSSELSVWEDEKTSLRDALWWADMTTTPDGGNTTIHYRLLEIELRYGPENLVTKFIHCAKSELLAAVERTEERMRVAGLGHLAK